MQTPRNLISNNNPPIFYLFYLHSDGQRSGAKLGVRFAWFATCLPGDSMTGPQLKVDPSWPHIDPSRKRVRQVRLTDSRSAEHHVAVQAPFVSCVAPNLVCRSQKGERMHPGDCAECTFALIPPRIDANLGVRRSRTQK